MCEIKRPRRPLIHVEAGERRRYRISARPAVSLFVPHTPTTTFPLFCFPLGGVERQPDSLPLLPRRLVSLPVVLTAPTCVQTCVRMARGALALFIHMA